jgi:hypothetical protein
MSYTSASQHCPTELVFVDADDITNVVTYRSASYSRPGAEHTTTLNTRTGERTCTCTGCAHGRECWRVTLIAAAWEGHPARVLARQYTAKQLRAAGDKHRNMIAIYRNRCWRTLPADRVGLVACRQEFRERRALATRDEATKEVA